MPDTSYNVNSFRITTYVSINITPKPGSILSDAEQWFQLFSHGFVPSQHGFRVGDVVRDLITQNEFRLTGVPGFPGNEAWAPTNAFGSPGFTASAPVRARRLLTITAPGQVQEATLAGQVYYGVSLNQANTGEQVYVQILGGALVTAAPIPPALLDDVVTDVTGSAGKPSPGDKTCALCMSPVIPYLAGENVIVVGITGISQRTV